MKLTYVHVLTCLCFLCIIACNSPEQKKTTEKNNETATDSGKIKLELVSTAINFPVQMDAPKDNSHRLFIADLSGKVWIMKKDSVQPKPFLDITDRLEKRDTSIEKKGLFSIAFHPQFSSNRKFYVCYNAPATSKNNVCKIAISEFTASENNPDSADTKSEHRVFEFECKGAEGLASQIGFGPDGYLYISIGDHGEDSTYKFYAQDLNHFNGKLLRIDVNKQPYAIPADNPFVGIKDERPEIWAYGFRRLWRFSFDPKTQQLFGGDVGESKNEEVDIITKGANYGWPIKEGDSMHTKSDQINNALYTEPIAAYRHTDGICVIGGSFYYGKDIPDLENKYVFADFNGNLFSLAKGEEGKWTRDSLRIINKPADPLLISSFNIDDNDQFYVLGFLNKKKGFEGVIYKIVKG